MKKEKSCGVILYKDGGEYLLLKHAEGNWDFPKGHVEANETEYETALREVKEETGLTVEIIPGFRESITYIMYGSIEKEVVFFLGHIRSKAGSLELQASEIKDFRYLSYEEARELITFGTNKELLDKAEAFRQGLPG